MEECAKRGEVLLRSNVTRSGGYGNLPRLLMSIDEKSRGERAILFSFIQNDIDLVAVLVTRCSDPAQVLVNLRRGRAYSPLSARGVLFSVEK